MLSESSNIFVDTLSLAASNAFENDRVGFERHGRSLRTRRFCSRMGCRLLRTSVCSAVVRPAPQLNCTLHSAMSRYVWQVNPDLNLLRAMDVLLDAGSVVGAAKRLRLGCLYGPLSTVKIGCRISACQNFSTPAASHAVLSTR